MEPDRSIILIDGSNFYNRLKELGISHLTNFHFSDFANWLAGSSKIVGKTYHVGAIKSDGSEKADKMYRDQQALFANLRKHAFSYKLGYLLKTNGKYHEKGVDVNLAIAMVKAAYEKQCERIILISSDTDLLPAVTVAKKKAVTVEYIGFAHSRSYAMTAQCSAHKVLTANDLSPFVDPDR